MNPLPQRKKTAEEIAALRDTFMPQAPAPSAVGKPAEPQAPAEPEQSRYAPPQEVSSQAVPSAIPAPAPHEPVAPVEAKPVRSLRRSERVPLPAKTANPIPLQNPQSTLPSHRHSTQELNYIRRAQAFEVQAPAKHLIQQTAHPILLGAGYASAFLAAFLPIVDWQWTEISYYLPAGWCGLAILIAGFIALKKRRSIHHVAFIGLISLFTIVFGTLYYFPQLRNGP